MTMTSTAGPIRLDSVEDVDAELAKRTRELRGLEAVMDRDRPGELAAVERAREQIDALLERRHALTSE